MPKQTKQQQCMLDKVRAKVSGALSNKSVGDIFDSTQMSDALGLMTYTARSYVGKTLAWFATQGYLRVLNPSVRTYRKYKVLKIPTFTPVGEGKSGMKKPANPFPTVKPPKERLEELEHKVDELFTITDGIMDKVKGWV